ncbi:MAG: hypothetical protein IKM25_06195, partial [Clostridia bacterium]|nr:hypothetical protein [Clostridia bacterium]
VKKTVLWTVFSSTGSRAMKIQKRYPKVDSRRKPTNIPLAARQASNRCISTVWGFLFTLR